MVDNEMRFNALRADLRRTTSELEAVKAERDRWKHTAEFLSDQLEEMRTPAGRAARSNRQRRQRTYRPRPDMLVLPFGD
jgi:hypothetical protein